MGNFKTMTPATGGVRRAELVILNRYYLESDACDPAYRGMGRFLRDMREAGFGALSRDSDLLAVDATTGFTRFNCDLNDYVCTTVARNPQHIFTVEHGFKVIGAHPWAPMYADAQRDRHDARFDPCVGESGGRRRCSPDKTGNPSAGR